MRTSRFFSALSSVLFLALCAYAGAYIYPKATQKAAPDVPRAEVTQTVTLRGVAVRYERVFDCAGTAENAQRLSVGSPFGIDENGDELYSDASAVYFSESDGFEYLSPDKLDELNPDELEELLSMPVKEASSPRLVTGFAWYFIALVPDTVPVPETGRCRLLFDGFQNETDAYLVSASAADNGRRVLLFRLTAGGEAYLSLRQTSANIDIKLQPTERR